MKKLKKSAKDMTGRITKSELLRRLNTLENRIRELESELFSLRQKHDDVGLLGTVLQPAIPSITHVKKPVSCPSCKLNLLESRVCMSTACPFANQVTCTY